MKRVLVIILALVLFFAGYTAGSVKNGIELTQKLETASNQGYHQAMMEVIERDTAEREADAEYQYSLLDDGESLNGDAEIAR